MKNTDNLTVTDKLKDAIFARVKQFNYVSFAELRDFEGFAGDSMMTAGENVILWENMSKEAIDAVTSLVAEEKISMIPPSSILIYALDGLTLKLPLATFDAKGKPKQYKKPRWLPMLLVLPGSKNEVVKL